MKRGSSNGKRLSTAGSAAMSTPKHRIWHVPAHPLLLQEVVQEVALRQLEFLDVIRGAWGQGGRQTEFVEAATAE